MLEHLPEFPRSHIAHQWAWNGEPNVLSHNGVLHLATRMGGNGTGLQTKPDDGTLIGEWTEPRLIVRQVPHSPTESGTDTPGLTYDPPTDQLIHLYTATPGALRQTFTERGFKTVMGRSRRSGVVGRGEWINDPHEIHLEAPHQYYVQKRHWLMFWMKWRNVWSGGPKEYSATWEDPTVSDVAHTHKPIEDGYHVIFHSGKTYTEPDHWGQPVEHELFRSTCHNLGADAPLIVEDQEPVLTTEELHPAYRARIPRHPCVTRHPDGSYHLVILVGESVRRGLQCHTTAIAHLWSHDKGRRGSWKWDRIVADYDSFGFVRRGRCNRIGSPGLHFWLDSVALYNDGHHRVRTSKGKAFYVAEARL